jgi:hypothetical protein
MLNELKYLPTRVIVKCDMEEKNWHTFADGTKIRLERKWNNLDCKHTQLTQGTVVSAESAPIGTLMLYHHNGNHPVNELFNYKPLDGKEIASEIKYFSIPESMCYAYYDGEKWLPLKGYEFALRVFTPYEGILLNMPNRKIRNTLYVTTGEYKGKVVRTVRAADYPIIFNDPVSGQEKHIIRFRHFDYENPDREEVMAIDRQLTDLVNNGKICVGINDQTCTRLKDYYERESNAKREVTNNSRHILSGT